VKLAHCNWNKNQHHEPLPLLTWFVTSQALYNHGGQAWAQWQKEFLPTIIRNQQEDGRLCIPISGDGSGEKERAMWGAADSNIYSTCIIPILFYTGRYLPTYIRPKEVQRPAKAAEADAELKAEISL
jgi:hypothetical protein